MHLSRTNFILALTVSLLIAGVESQAINCNSNSHDCFWVSCGDSTKSKVIELECDNLVLKGRIPAEIAYKELNIYY